MNRLLMMSLTALSLLALNGCDDKNNNSNQTTYTPTTQCEAYGNPITSFVRVQAHYGLLRDQAYIPGESGGLLPLTVTKDAAAGSTTIHVDSTTALVIGQLITYLGENYDYNVAKIASLTNTTITLTNEAPVFSKISTGKNVWNFYNEASVANSVGQKSLADLSYRSSAQTVTSGATHVIIGDGWLNDHNYTNRLKLRYPSATIINKAADTNSLCDLLANFDNHVTPHAPKYVWISSSINESKAGVLQNDYKLRLKDLIAKVQGIGATAIVIDAVAGSSETYVDGVSSQQLAQRYSTQIYDLYTETEGSTEPPVTTANCDATAQPINTFNRIQMHYDLLKDQTFVFGSNGVNEAGGQQSYNVTSASSAGDNTLAVTSTDGLLVDQLITYKSTDTNYYVAKISSLTSTQITLTTGITSNIGTGNNLWNFYRDSDHPNLIGSKAIVDYAYASAAANIIPNSTHVLLGDSWFTSEGTKSRLEEKMPDATVINKSIGGNTLCDLLARFDRDVTPNAPDYVWINSSVNDYLKNVSQDEYKIRMQNLIAKVQSISATAIVFDSAPAAPRVLSGNRYTLEAISRGYASQLLDLYNEANTPQ